jgi:hypothetical protein
MRVKGAPGRSNDKEPTARLVVKLGRVSGWWQMEVDVAFLDEGHRLAVAMGLHARLGGDSPLSALDRDALATLRGQLGWGPAPEGGCSHRPAEGEEAAEEAGSRAPPAALRDAAAAGRRIPVDITFYSSQIKKNLLQQHGVRACCARRCPSFAAPASLSRCAWFVAVQLRRCALAGGVQPARLKGVHSGGGWPLPCHPTAGPRPPAIVLSLLTILVSLLRFHARLRA